MIFLSSEMTYKEKISKPFENIKTSVEQYTNCNKGVGFKCCNQLIEPDIKFFKIIDDTSVVVKRFNTSSMLMEATSIQIKHSN